MERNNCILEIDSLFVSYGQIEALRKVTIVIRKGELVVLIGANGSGKSTVLKTILGLQRPNLGTIRFMERDITRLATEHIVAMGIALVPEGRGVLPLMTVAENLELGAYHRKGDISKDRESIFHRFPILKNREHQQAGKLSGGEQQMLVIARSMMASPTLLMMDEPSLGLAPIIVTELFRTITQLRMEGYTILLAEQNAKKALGCADRGYVFEVGSVSFEGTAQDLKGNPKVRNAYLGANA